MKFTREKMNSRDRIKALLSGEPVDRVPLFPFLLGFCARNVGYPISSIYDNAEKSFDAQMKTLEQYRFDWGPIYGYASYGTWEFGGEIRMPSGGYEQAPIHGAYPVKTEEDIEKLVIPDVKNAGCIPLAMEFSRLQEKHGYPISVVLGGNFTIAGNICDVSKLCRWMLKKPELVHRLLQRASDHIVSVVSYWVDTFGAKRVIPQFWEPLTANIIISPKHFKEIVLPYVVETSEKILAMGVRHVLYHICGEQNANLPYWAEVPMGDPGLCSFGEEIDHERAIDIFGEKCVVIGNVDPRDVLTGPPEKIRELCVSAMEKGREAPRGFMLSSGCEVSPETPPYHVYTMQKTVEEFS